MEQQLEFPFTQKDGQPCHKNVTLTQDMKRTLLRWDNPKQKPKWVWWATAALLEQEGLAIIGEESERECISELTPLGIAVRQSLISEQQQ